MSEQVSSDICQERRVHPESLEQVRREMPEFDVLCDLADLFKALSDRTRVHILFALSKVELCVCDLTEVLGMSSSAVSHQLRVLRASKLVTFRREGKNVFYRLADDHVQKLFEQALEHVRE
ncbi:MAG: metalloregulator ArsR/SmtB family transcription factor [Desulfovermiculus sp.]